MEKRTGVYICTGCGMGEAIASAALTRIATEEYSSRLKEHPCLAVPTARLCFEAIGGAD